MRDKTNHHEANDMNDDIESAARRTIQRMADANSDREFADWPAYARDAYRTAVALLTLPSLMTVGRVRELIGEVPSVNCYADLAEAANLDRHEGREWLPRYKLALSLLANCVGTLDGVCSKLAFAWADKPEGATVAKLRAEAKQLWIAHLRAVADTPDAVTTGEG